MSHYRRIVLLGVSLFAFASPAIAQNQDESAPPPADDNAVESGEVTGTEIVVEARRRDESAQDVPLVVNAVTSEKINELNLRDFKDISTVVPGLQMASNTNGIGTTSSVRGVQFDVNAAGNNGTIEYYLNDAPLTSSPLFLAMYDIGQIEVLRGPQGTLRGRASPSGSITIAHRKPDLYEVGGYALGTVNDIGGANVNGAVGVPIIPGKLAIRVAGLVERGRGTRVRSINAPNVDPFTRTKSGRVFVRFEPTDWLNAEGTYSRIETKVRQFDQNACFDQFNQLATPAPVALACPVVIEPGDRLGIKSRPQTNRQDFDIFTWKASAGFAGQRLYYVGQHTAQDVDAFAPQDEANSFPALNLGQYSSNRTRITSHEVRLQNEERVLGLFDYAAGYFRNKLKAPTYLLGGRLQPVPIPAGPVTNIPSATLRLTRTQEESYFGNLSVHLGEATEISGGARHIKIKQVSSLGAVSVPGGIVLPPPIATDVSAQVLSGTVTNLAFGAVNRQFEKTIYAASAKHRFNDDLMVYANFGTSFRPGNNVVRGTVNGMPSALELSFLNLPSETSKSYEIGVKSEFFDDTVKVNLAAYRQDFKNYPFRSASGVPYLQYAIGAGGVVSTTPSVATFNFVSPVPVRVEGFELELEWRPSDRLNMAANVAYALGKIKNGQVACLDLNGDGVPESGTPSPAALLAAVGANNLSTCAVNFRSSLAAPWSANFQGEYSLPVSSASEGFLRTLVTYSGKSLNDPANPFDNYDAYARVNLYAGLRDPDGAWEVSLYGKNIFEDETVLATSNGAAFTSITIANVNSPYIALGNPSSPGIAPPREFGITARFAFGSR